jgi:DNA-binding XRE family transcriptional regulator
MKRVSRDVLRELRTRVKAARKVAGVSQEEFARLAGVCGQTIGRLELGKLTRSYQFTVDAINDALRVMGFGNAS